MKTNPKDDDFIFEECLVRHRLIDDTLVGDMLDLNYLELVTYYSTQDEADGAVATQIPLNFSRLELLQLMKNQTLKLSKMFESWKHLTVDLPDRA